MVVEILETCPACKQAGRIRASGTFGLCDKCHGIALAITRHDAMRRQPLRSVFDGERYRCVAAWLAGRQAT